jgi:carboxymethylenebutenolidase
MTGRDIRIPVDGGEVAGVEFRPVGDVPRPAIVLGAEATGVNTFIRQVGERLAAAGFVAVVPDYYRGQGPADPDDYSDFPALVRHIDALDFRQGTYDLLAAVDYVRSRPYVDPARVFTWGYCTGGTLAMLAGCLDRALAGTVLFYPSQPVFPSLTRKRPVHPKDLVWNHRPPMALFYGDEDRAVPLTVQRELYDELDRWGVDATIRTYSGAGHVFAGHAGDSYRETADVDSWKTAMHFVSNRRTAA